MKIRSLVVILLTLGILCPAYAQKKKDKDKNKDKAVEAPASKLENKLDTVSYCLGVLFGSTLTHNGFTELKTQKLASGIDEMLAQKTPLFDEAKANEIIGQYVVEIRKNKAEKNLAEGKAFLEKNKTEPGVITLPGGLQYKVLKEGNGPKPDSASTVTVHYHGTLVNGKVFDSSVERGQPIQLNMDNIIEGWKEALALMPVGSKWKLFIPSSLAYGENPRPGGPIEPNMVLLFEVELISIDKDQPEETETIQPQEDTNENNDN